MRMQHGIPTACPLHTQGTEPRADGLMPVLAAARRLGVSPSLIHVWMQHDVLTHDQRRSASRVWVRLTAEDLARLDGSNPSAPQLPSFAELTQAEHLSREALWDRVRRGEYQAFRVRRGRVWQWHLQRASGPGVGCGSERPDHHE
jgi:hypothetical protein